MKCFRVKQSTKTGSALAYVIIILMIFSVLSLVMINIFNSNLKQTKYIQNNLEAYYLSYSGALIGYEALLANNSQKLDALTKGTVIPASTILFDNGNAVVSVVISTDENFEDWIKISSKATLTKNGLVSTRIMYFNPADPLDILWKNN